MNGFLVAAIGFSLVDILNRDERAKFNLSPLYMAVVAFCFSMTIDVMWEFFECGMDLFFGMDTQKDTIVNSINTVMLDPTGGNQVIHIGDINSVIVNGKELGLGGYLDIGLLDTMKDLFVNFIGAVVFSIIGFLLCEKTRKGENYKHIYSETKAGRSRFFENPGRIRGEIVNIGYFYDTEFDALQWGN